MAWVASPKSKLVAAVCREEACYEAAVRRINADADKEVDVSFTTA